MALSITGGDGTIGSQANTQTPQASVGPATKAAPSRNVQPGTTASVLTTQSGGISLTSQALPSVKLGDTSTATVQASAAPQAVQAKHHLNPVLLGLAIALFMLAIGFFWITHRSAKNTTK